MNGVALESALVDCNTALASTPNVPAFLDNKAFVLLRLGRIDEAIATFDRALAGEPKMAPSLFGRAIAWSRKGDKAKAQADKDAALKIEPNIQKQYESYGVTMEPDAAKS